MSVTEGLTGAWVPAKGATGRLVTDWSAYRQHASLTSAVTVESSPYGWTTNYNNSTGATLAYGGHLQTGFPFTVAAWVKYPAVGVGSTGREFFHTDTDTGTTSYWGYSLGAVNSGSANKDVFLLRYGNGTTANRTFRPDAPATLVLDAWYHVVVTVRAHITGEIYVNALNSGGVWAGSATGISHNAGTPRIGYDTRTSRAWTSQIADVRTWNRALTAAEVAELYRGGPGYGIGAPLTRHWRAYAIADGGITGTAAATTDAATSTASGGQVFSGAATPAASGDGSAALGQLRFESPLISAPYIALADDASAANAAQVFVSVVFHNLAPDTSAAFAVAGGSSGSAAAITGSDSSLFFGKQLFQGLAFSFTGNDTSLFFGLAGGYGGQVVASLSGDTGVASGVLKFTAVGNPSLGGDSVTNQQGAVSPTDVQWEDAYTIDWESGESIRWDEQLVIQASLLGVAGPASLAAFGTNTPPPASSGFVFASSGPATAFPPAIGRLKFIAAGSATGGSATAAIAAVTVVGQTVVNATLFTGHDYLTVTASLKFTAFVVGDSGPATGICIGPLCDVDGALSSQLGNDFVFVDSDGCRLVARESEHVFVASVSRYIFRASACTVIA